MDPVTYNINLTGVDELTSSAATAAIGGIFGFALAAGVAIAIILIIALWRVFEKAGEKGWKVLIPIYNFYILFKICGIEKWFWGFLGVSIFAGILSAINPPVYQTAVYVNGTLTVTDVSSLIDYSQHIPYLIGTILSAGVSLAAAIVISVKLAKAFGKGVGFTLGLIFLSGIFYMILGFGKAKYSAKNLK